MEDQLTEMLAWLAEAVPAVRSAVVRLALGDDAVDPDTVEVSTQHGIAVGRLDAYFTGSDFALVVESKLGSEYGDGQIRKYLDWLSGGAVAQPRRALMTLTARPAPWFPEDLAYADVRGVVARSRLWEELHEALDTVASDESAGAVGARLVGEFLEMLSEEGLVPTKPLTGTEMGSTWPNAWTTVRRYRDFFNACKARIAERTGTSQLCSSSDRGDWFWQDFQYDDGSRLVVGLLCTDEHERLPPGAHRIEPIVWMGVKGDHLPDWDARLARLNYSAPEGWRAGNLWWGRPTAWRYLAEVIDEGSFEEQRDRLADAATAARGWLEGVAARSARQSPRADPNPDSGREIG